MSEPISKVTKSQVKDGYELKFLNDEDSKTLSVQVKKIDEEAKSTKVIIQALTQNGFPWTTLKSNYGWSKEKDFKASELKIIKDN